MADFIKGNNFQHLPEGVIKGIKLHRAIDDFTDTHEIVKKDIKIFYPHYKRYSGIVIDILYDYFLIKHWNLFSTHDLDEFITSFYKLVDTHQDMMPQMLQEIYPKMVSENWLLNYGNYKGLERTFLAMTARLNHAVDFKEVVSLFKPYEQEIEKDFLVFFKELETYVQHYRMLLN